MGSSFWIFFVFLSPLACRIQGSVLHFSTEGLMILFSAKDFQFYILAWSSARLIFSEVCSTFPFLSAGIICKLTCPLTHMILFPRPVISFQGTVTFFPLFCQPSSLMVNLNCFSSPSSFISNLSLSLVGWVNLRKVLYLFSSPLLPLFSWVFLTRYPASIPLLYSPVLNRSHLNNFWNCCFSLSFLRKGG